MLGPVNQNSLLTRSWTLKAARTSWSDPPVSSTRRCSLNTAPRPHAQNPGGDSRSQWHERSVQWNCAAGSHIRLFLNVPGVNRNNRPYLRLFHPSPFLNSRTLCGLAPLRAHAVLSLQARKDSICTRDVSLPRGLQIPQALRLFTPRECRSGI